ncbi:MAG: T9SS type A sorting domain-containing protein [Bacteroidetes bacterium]|nr:T9SS type A sorting domain-containing protein [Bacteroidota bacterium]
MKIKYSLFLAFFWLTVSFSSKVNAQGGWTQKADIISSGRAGAVGFSIGTKGYFGTGSDNTGAVLNDFWEYDPSTNTWTQKADFAGAGRKEAVGFSIAQKGYVGTGWNGSGLSAFYSDFFEFDPTTNIWIQKADFAGGGRIYSVGFSIGSKGFLGTGWNSSVDSIYNDFWEYDPAFDLWTRKSDFGGTVRVAAVGFSIGNLGYIGLGADTSGPINLCSDFWEYNPATNSWIQKSSPFLALSNCIGFAVGNYGYVGTGRDWGSNPHREFLKYDPSNNIWTVLPDFPGLERENSICFSIGSKGYIGTGFGDFGYLNDFWEYDPTLSGSFEINNGNFISSISFPEKNKISVTLNNLIKTGSVMIYNLNGSLICQSKIQNSNLIEVQPGSIASGIYLLSIFDGKEHYKRKFVFSSN